MAFNSKLPTKLAVISLVPMAFAVIFIAALFWFNEFIYDQYVHLAGTSGLDIEQSERWHQLVLVSVLIGASATGGGVLWLVKSLQANLKSRIDIIADNARRFSAGNQLRPAIGGSDELSDLDAAFHRMFDELTQSKLAEKRQHERRTQITAMIAHDLKTPLTSTEMFLDLLVNDTYEKSSDELKAKALVARNDAKRLVLLIANLLDFEMAETGRLSIRKRTTKAAELLVNAVASMEPTATINNVTLTCAPTDALLYADPDRITQVLVNLLANAIRFSPSGQSVTVSSRIVNDQYEISCRDHGPGIPDSAVAKIFDPYTSFVDEPHQRGSAGLGLAIVSHIVGAHNGDIRVEPTLDGGATFIVSLPLDTQSSIIAVQSPNSE